MAANGTESQVIEIDSSDEMVVEARCRLLRPSSRVETHFTFLIGRKKALRTACPDRIAVSAPQDVTFSVHLGAGVLHPAEYAVTANVEVEVNEDTKETVTLKGTSGGPGSARRLRFRVLGPDAPQREMHTSEAPVPHEPSTQPDPPDWRVPWQELTDGRLRRFKRGVHYSGAAESMEREAQGAADALDKTAITVRDDLAGLGEYIWVQFLDGKLEPGDPCIRCGNKALETVQEYFARCPSCKAFYAMASSSAGPPASEVGSILGIRLLNPGGELLAPERAYLPPHHADLSDNAVQAKLHWSVGVWPRRRDPSAMPEESSRPS